MRAANISTDLFVALLALVVGCASEPEEHTPVQEPGMIPEMSPDMTPDIEPDEGPDTHCTEQIWEGTFIGDPEELAGYISVTGELIIQDRSDWPKIRNLDSLACLQSVGRLTILFAHSLTNVDGLSSLTSIDGDLHIVWNDSLTDVDGLSSLTSIGADLQIGANALLNNVDGLSSLISIRDLRIVTNNSLTNVDGFSSLTSVGTNLTVKSNNSLTDVDGLSSLTSIGGTLFIQDNESLCQDDVDTLINLLNEQVEPDLLTVDISGNTGLCQGE